MSVNAKTGKLNWDYTEIERGISTASIADGLVYAADYRGRVHCVDVKTGKKAWVYDTKSHIWGSTLVADGKVFIGNEDGEVVILKTGRKMEKIGLVEFSAPVYASPVIANVSCILPVRLIFTLSRKAARLLQSKVIRI
jgi:outer membrane protein assembly factor BamB